MNHSLIAVKDGRDDKSSSSRKEHELFHLALFIIVLCLFLTQAAHADPTQMTMPGSSNYVGSVPQQNEVHPNITNSNLQFNSGSVGPNTVPSYVNQNGTVNTSPAILNKIDESKPRP